MSKWLRKSYKIEIFLLKDFIISNNEHWMFTKEYMSF